MEKYIELESEFITPIQQYLAFFYNYVKIAKKQEIHYDVKRINTGIKISFKENNSLSTNQIAEYLEEYMLHLECDIDSLIVNLVKGVSQYESELLLVGLRNEIRNIESKLEWINVLYRKDKQKTLEIKIKS